MFPTVTGSCLCGAVVFRAPGPARWVAHCHCTRCQRAHGAPFVTWVGFEAEQVALDDPAGRLHWFTTPEGAARGFCSQCGSPMFFKSGHYPGELHVARALIQPPFAQAPQVNAFYSTRAGWAEDVHQLPGEPEPGWSRAAPDVLP